jgi:hypothetical protein
MIKGDFDPVAGAWALHIIFFLIIFRLWFEVFEFFGLMNGVL